MKNSDTNTDKLAVLTDVLDQFGSDARRWPVNARKTLASFVKTDAHAREMLAQAVALDEVLQTAGDVDPAREEAVAARIFAALDQELDVNIEVKTASEGREQLADVLPFKPRQRISSDQWQTAGMLAASLFIGVFAGRAGLFDTMVSGVQTALTTPVSTSAPMLTALVEDDADDLADEDLL